MTKKVITKKPERPVAALTICCRDCRATTSMTDVKLTSRGVEYNLDSLLQRTGFKSYGLYFLCKKCGEKPQVKAQI